MSASLSSKEFLNSGGGLTGKILGGVAIAAVVSMRPFRVIKNNEVGFRRRTGKVNRAIVPPDENATRIAKIFRKIKPDRSGTPMPRMLKPGLHGMVPFGHSIEVVGTQPRTTDLGIVPVDRDYYRKVQKKGTDEWVLENYAATKQFDLHAKVNWHVSALGNNPYRAVDEVDELDATVQQICSGALSKSARSIDDIRKADPNLLTNVVNYYAYKRLLKIGVELLHVTAISDVRSFAEMVQTRDGSSGLPSAAVLGHAAHNGVEGIPELHSVQ